MNRYFMLICLLGLYFIFGFSQSTDMQEHTQDTKRMNANEKIHYYIKISQQWKNRNPDSALYFSNLAYKAAIKSGKKYEIRRTLLSISKQYETKAKYDTALSIINTITKVGTKQDSLYYEALIVKSRVLDRKDQYQDALENLEKSLKYFVTEGDSSNVKEVATIQADVYTSIGNFPKAMNAYQRALHIAEVTKDTTSMILQHTKIGSMFMRMEDFVSAKKHFKIGKSISDNFSSTRAYKTLLSNYANYFNRKHVYDSAEMYYLEGLGVTKKLGKKDDIAGAYLNLGNLYCRQHQFKRGKTHFDTALAIFTDLGLEANMAIVYHSYSTMFAVLGQFDSSLYYAKKSLKIGRKTKNSKRIKSSLYRIATVYDKLGDYKKSLTYAKKYIFYNDSVTSAETRAKVAELEAKYEAAKKERDIIKLKAEQKAQKDKEMKLQITFGAVVIILVFMIGGIIQKRKKDRKIYEQQQLVFTKEKELAKANLEKSKLKESELRKEIQYKSKQLTTHALNMIQKNTLMQEIQGELNQLSQKTKSNDRTSFQKLHLLIKRNLRSEKEWELFKLYFEDVNKTFYEKLTKINAELSSKDLKLCALLKLNMNIKESASVLNIEPASVKTARYKLRKKLKLTPEENLVEFIRKID